MIGRFINNPTRFSIKLKNKQLETDQRKVDMRLKNTYYRRDKRRY